MVLGSAVLVGLVTLLGSSAVEVSALPCADAHALASGVVQRCEKVLSRHPGFRLVVRGEPGAVQLGLWTRGTQVMTKQVVVEPRECPVLPTALALVLTNWLETLEYEPLPVPPATPVPPVPVAPVPVPPVLVAPEPESPTRPASSRMGLVGGVSVDPTDGAPAPSLSAMLDVELGATEPIRWSAGAWGRYEGPDDATLWSMGLHVGAAHRWTRGPTLQLLTGPALERLTITSTGFPQRTSDAQWAFAWELTGGFRVPLVDGLDWTGLVTLAHLRPAIRAELASPALSYQARGPRVLFQTGLSWGPIWGI